MLRRDNKTKTREIDTPFAKATARVIARVTTSARTSARDAQMPTKTVTDGVP
jgi:hypothetical protein